MRFLYSVLDIFVEKKFYAMKTVLQLNDLRLTNQGWRFYTLISAMFLE